MGKQHLFIWTVIFLALVASIHGADSELECGDSLYSDYTMDGNLAGCSGDGINIGADNIVLDCNNYAIEGVGFGNGINLVGKSNVVIKNCNITNFDRGINIIEGSNNNEIYYNSVFNNDLSGIHIGHSSYNLIRDNVIRTNNYRGVNIFGAEYFSNENEIRNNLIEDNKCSGIKIQGAGNKNLIKSNNILSNGLSFNCGDNERGGVIIESGFDSEIKNNLIDGNILSGIHIRWADNTLIINNIIRGSSTGLRIFESDDNLIDGNSIKGMTNGIYLEVNSDNNEINNNDLCTNEVSDLRCGTFTSGFGEGNFLNILDGNGDCSDVLYSLCEEEPPEEPICGNGILEEGEECDDGNNEDGDGCSADCRIEDDDDDDDNGIKKKRGGDDDPICGDGVIDYQIGEFCDIKNYDLSYCYLSPDYKASENKDSIIATGCYDLLDFCYCKWSDFERGESNIVFEIYDDSSEAVQEKELSFWFWIAAVLVIIGIAVLVGYLVFRD